MTYIPKTWVNGVIPLSAQNMNHIEQGIVDNETKIDGNTLKLDSSVKNIEASLTANTIKIIKNDNTTTSVTIPIEATVELKNDLTQTQAGFALDSTQGKILDDKLSNLLERFKGKILTVDDMNNRFLKNGSYAIPPDVATTILGFSTSVGYQVIIADYNELGYPVQYISATANGGLYIRQFDGGTSTWTLSKLATTSKIDISLLNGWTSGGTTTIKRSLNGNIVSCNALLAVGTTTDGTIVCSGLPTTAVSFDFFLDTYNTTGTSIRSLFSYNTNGTIACRGGTVGLYCHFNFSFAI